MTWWEQQRFSDLEIPLDNHQHTHESADFLFVFDFFRQCHTLVKIVVAEKLNTKREMSRYLARAIHRSSLVHV